MQKIIHDNVFLKNVIKKGEYLRNTLHSELKDNDFFYNVRGRGMRNTLEYNCDNKNLFGSLLKEKLFNNDNIIIDAKWHRVLFPMSLLISDKELSKNLSIIIKGLKKFKKIGQKKK